MPTLGLIKKHSGEEGARAVAAPPPAAASAPAAVAAAQEDESHVVVNAEVVEGRAQPLLIYAERRGEKGAAS